MKSLLSLLAVLIQITVLAQTRDTRAKLDIMGRTGEANISPDGKIWLVSAMGETYYSNGIDSDWHYVMKSEKTKYPAIASLDAAQMERVTFFDKDRAIITGYISSNPKDFTKDGYYRTTDGGKTWTLLSYGGNSWIYDACADARGNMWMGGSSGDIFYSHDFGEHWEKLKSPFGNNRMHRIYMVDDKRGIGGALSNNIYSTENNWATNQQIPSPLDQKKYTGGSSFSDDRIEQIVLFGHYIAVNQNGHIFYTDEKNIQWQKFPVDVQTFTSDGSKLYAVTSDLRVLEFSDPLTYKPFTDIHLKKLPTSITLVNGALYFSKNASAICRISPTEYKEHGLYTTDQPISDMDLIAKGQTLTWGSDGEDLYLSDNNGEAWYREASSDFPIHTIRPLGDTGVILWDGAKNHLYSLRTHAVTDYTDPNPIKDFMSTPVRRMLVESGSQGCFHHFENYVSWEDLFNSTLTVRACSTDRNSDYTTDQGRDVPQYKNPLYHKDIKAQDIALLLAAIDSAPYAVPAIADFHITEKDKNEYKAGIDEWMKGAYYGEKKTQKEERKAFYTKVPDMVDTLSGSVVTDILDEKERMTSTTSMWFTIKLTNESGDSLIFYKRYYTQAAWHLPWVVAYHGYYFMSHDIRFSRFIDGCLPDDFYGKSAFRNSALLAEIASYLYDKKQKK